MSTIKHAGYELDWEDIGEGLAGDYNPGDPNDIPLLRFSVSQDGEQIENGSYCTLVRADAPQSWLDHAGLQILTSGVDKRSLERASWIEWPEA